MTVTVKRRRLLISLVMAASLAFAPQVFAQATAQPATPAQTDQTATEEPIGNVATVQGTATVTRNNAISALKVQDDIYKNDVLVTAGNSSLGVTFNDATTFNLTANSRIVVDNYVYEEGGKNNAAVFNVARGTVAFVAAAVAKTGDMQISTPTATLGIRGTTGLVEVPEGASATGANNVGIKLYPDQDGKVGRIDIRGRDGSSLGFLNQAATGFAIRGGAGGRFSAVPLQISAAQMARDQGFVRQVHSFQTAGRQIVQQQRTLRLQRNPQLRQPGQQLRQPGLQKQNDLQKRQPGLQKQNDLQKQGQQKQQPGSRPIDLQKNQPGQQTQRSGLPTQPRPLPPSQLGQRPAGPPIPSQLGQRPAGPQIPGLPRLQNQQQRGPLGLPKQQKHPPADEKSRGHRN
ncbi:MAG: FecR domain-containing protein [Afipia sp.]|nr:FecR domain-containing protein [Afipia sp.]